MLRLFLPEICVHCGDSCDTNKRSEALAKYLCSVCLRIFHHEQPPSTDDLRMLTTVFNDFSNAIDYTAAFIFRKDDIVQSLIHHFKYLDMPKLAEIVGAVSWHQTSLRDKQYDYIIPVPLHRTRYSERGFNQSERLAKGISSVSHFPVAKRGWLKRVRPTPSQTGLSFIEREENVRGAFELTKRGLNELNRKSLLIVDDVITTGATMASVVRTLESAKPKRLDVFSFAAVIENSSS